MMMLGFPDRSSVAEKAEESNLERKSRSEDKDGSRACGHGEKLHLSKLLSSRLI